MIETIRDALSRYALGRAMPGIGVVDFEIYCSRGSTLGLLNYTDRLAGAFGRVVFSTSWTERERVPAWIPARSLITIEFGPQAERQEHLIHSPAWTAARSRFLRELAAGYDRLNTEKRTLYVQVADLRDLVCYALRISDVLFDRFLARVYHETMQGAIDSLRISLEADEIKEARAAQTTKRNPLYLATSAPRTMISVSRRRT
jgi:hypothetical protein